MVEEVHELRDDRKKKKKIYTGQEYSSVLAVKGGPREDPQHEVVP